MLLVFEVRKLFMVLREWMLSCDLPAPPPPSCMKRLLVVTALRFETGSFNLVAIMVQRGALLTLAGRAFFCLFVCFLSLELF